MYFNKKNKFFHGIMFHHFHDNEKHKKVQGSICQEDFIKIINFIGRDNILDADVFFEKSKKNILKNNDICFTFDDGIKCQIDIALPILEKFKIKSFFFAQTSMFVEKKDYLEIFRYFRMNYFTSVDEFYFNFYKVLDKDLKNFFEKHNNKIYSNKKKFPFYSIEDIKFRLVRDIFLTKIHYEDIMFKMFKLKNFNSNYIFDKLFFDESDLKKLDNHGHLVGLHSHNHPTLIEKLNYQEQKNEYEKSQSIISKILNKPKNEIKFMSHPCGSYNNLTFKVLKDLGIELGFKSIMTIEEERGMKTINNTPLEIARQDHTEIIKMINK